MNQNLAVNYDRTLKLMTVSPSAWTATGPTQWFDAYRIITVVDNPLIGRLGIIDLRPYVLGKVIPRTVKQIFPSLALQRLIKDQSLDDYKFLLNRASSVLPSQSTLGNLFQVVNKFENKVWFRETFADKLNFPEFEIISMSELQASGAYQALADRLSVNLVVQHQKLAGSRGTYYVSSAEEFQLAISRLAETEALDDRIVIARRLNGVVERTLQACITENEIYVGPAQAQLVGHPLLTWQLPGEIQFCGGRIEAGLMTDGQYRVASNSVQLIGQSLKDAGYRGIFGVDFLIENNQVYVIETNPRMTGMTPLLAFLQRELPFLLLHILELAQSPYTIKASTAQTNGEGSFLQIFVQTDSSIAGQTGVYNSQLEKISDGFDNGSLLPDDNYFVGLRASLGEEIPAGKSFAFIYSHKQLFDDAGQLEPGVEQLVGLLRTKFVTSL